MASQRDVRRCALQCLYQFDAGISTAPDSPWSTPEPGESKVDPEAGRAGFDLATLAWEFRGDADNALAPLTPEWPLHRQPMVDRNILRLAHYEVTRAELPPRIAINEAVELAKEFGGERSPIFVNGVLDRLFRVQLDHGRESAPTTQPSREPTP